MTEAEALQAHYQAALARRLQVAPEAVQRLLRDRLDPPAADAAPTVAPAPTRPPAAPRPLAQLNRHIASASGQPVGARAELRSAQAFRETWERLGAEDEVQEAVQRGPENPGPLNPHSLVLRTLSLLSELSPDYLRRFLAQADTLLWLEEASARPKPAPTPKPKKPRPRP